MRVVRVRHMWVRVPHRFVPMPMAVFAHGHRVMHVVVVSIVVPVRMLVFERLMLVLVAMRLGQMQPHAGEHQHAARAQQQAR